jgi:GT2 family glycosyltransferase
MTDISCVYVNYNSSAYTIAAIASLAEFTNDDISYEIIVVDNASRYEDYEMLVTGLASLNLNNIQVFRSRINTGFGAGNMAGVHLAAPSKYYAFINNDTLFIKENTLKDLMAFMEQTPDAGVCGPQMLGDDRSWRGSIDHFATPWRQLLRKDFLEWYKPVVYPKRKVKHTKPIACNYVQGSFMFVDAAAFNMVGGFDTSLFLYYEESDLCMRIAKIANMKTYFYPEQAYIHFQGKSTPKNVVIKLEQKISLLYLTMKHHGRFAHGFLLYFYTIKYGLTALFSKDKRFLFSALFKGASINQSLRTKQVILEK